MKKEDKISKKIPYSKKECIDMAYAEGYSNAQEEILREINTEIKFTEVRLGKELPELNQANLSGMVIALKVLRESIRKNVNADVNVQKIETPNADGVDRNFEIRWNKGAKFAVENKNVVGEKSE